MCSIESRIRTKTGDASPYRSIDLVCDAAKS
jgi:hypothetical protein